MEAILFLVPLLAQVAGLAVLIRAMGQIQEAQVVEPN
jgi:hypothetical protein